VADRRQDLAAARPGLAGQRFRLRRLRLVREQDGQGIHYGSGYTVPRQPGRAGLALSCRFFCISAIRFSQNRLTKEQKATGNQHSSHAAKQQGERHEASF
jgi:hypothetical protein